MSFDASWLDLREGADHAARAGDLRDALAAWARARRQPVRVIDLGCGTGSTLRAVAPLLGEGQDWVLLDDDPELLAAARLRLLRWAGAGAGAQVIELEGSGWSARVRLLRGDLRQVEALPLEDRTIVTASALLDLVSRDWLLALLDRLPGRAFYAALNFDGRMDFATPDPDDDLVRDGFLAHQRRDKGFGPALGPAAEPACAALLEAGGWRLLRGHSDWLLGSAEAPLQRALLDGYAAAATEQLPDSKARIAGWRDRRLLQEGRVDGGLRVGHADLLGLPEEAAAQDLATQDWRRA